MKTEPIPNGRSTPAFSLRHVGVVFFSIAIVLQPCGALRGQEPASDEDSESFVPGDRDLVSIDFSKVPVGPAPSSIQTKSGTLDVVEKDGVHMLRSSSPATFLILIPEKIPNHFTLEFDIVPRSTGETGGNELSFEGTRDPNRGDTSAQVMWNHHETTVIGGGMDYLQSNKAFPDDLREEIIGNRTEVCADFDGDSFKLFTNGKQHFNTKGMKFVRGRVLRVELGGTDGGDNAVYLARFRMAASDGGPATAQNKFGLTATSANTSGGGAASNEMTPSSTDTHSASPVAAQTITGITVTVDASGLATVTWDPFAGASGYFVVRWNAADPYCCNNMSRPGEPLQSAAWVDGLLPKGGTYAYRVIAQTPGGLVYGDTQYSFDGSPRPPSGVAVSPLPTIRTPIASEPVLTNKPLPEPYASAVTNTATNTPTAPNTIVPPDGLDTVYSSGPRDVSVFNSEPAPTNETTLPAPSDLPTLDAAEPAPAPSTEPIVVAPAMQTATGMVMTAPTDSTSGGGGDVSPNQSQPGDQSSGGPGAPASGRYRVVIAGFSVAKVQNDDLLNVDGHGNEVYAAAAVVSWNRSTSQLMSFNTVETLDYGEVRADGFFGNRIKAGTGSMNGGIVAGNKVPSEYDPSGGGLPAPASDRFPLLVWEGTLTAGAESIVVCPSIWERDSVRAQFDNYKANWGKVSPSSLMSSAVIANKSSSSTLESVLAPIATSVVIAPPAPTFTGSPADGYKIAGLTFPPGIDRPIGMGLPAIAVLTYQDRLIVVTQENAGSLPVGGGVTLSLPLGEPLDPFLGALYTLYVRVEHLQ